MQMENQLSPLQKFIKLWFEEYDINFILEDIIMTKWNYEKSEITATVYGVVNDEELHELLAYMGITIESFDNEVMLLSDTKMKVRVYADSCKYGDVIDFNTMELATIIGQPKNISILVIA